MTSELQEKEDAKMHFKNPIFQLVLVDQCQSAVTFETSREFEQPVFALKIQSETVYFKTASEFAVLGNNL